MNPAEQLISLAFPSFQKPKKKRVDIGRQDTDNMSEAEYNEWFQGQGRLAESHPVASVVGPLKGFNVLRKWLLGQAVKPKPTTAPLALTDQSIDYPRLMAPPDRPRLEGPPDLPRLTYNPRRTDEEHQAYVNQVDDDFQRYLDHAQDEGPIENYTNAEMLRMGFTQAEIDRMEDEPGWEPVEGDFDEPDWDANAAVNFDAAGNRYPNDGSLVSDKEFYTPPKGYYSALSKALAGDSLTKAEKESAIREIKYSQLSYDRKLFDEGIHDPTRNSPVPGINDPEAIKKFKEEKPLMFTVRQSEDYVGGEEGTKASHLYFDSNQEGAQHFFSDGRPAQAFITHNVNGGTFNIEESQDETRGKGNTYSNQVITKLAQQTWIDFKDSGLSTITIPKGEPIFDKYYSTVGKGLWGDEKNLLKTKNDEEFAEKAFEFYNQPLIQNEAKKDVHKHLNTYKTWQRLKSELNAILDDGESVEGLSGEDLFEMTQMGHDPELIRRYGEVRDQWNEIGRRYGNAYADSLFYASRPGAIGKPIQASVDELTSSRAKKLKDLRGNYQGKVRHYNEYFKAWQKAGKQHGAELDIRETPEGWDVDLTNPEETFRKVETDGFTMAMILKKIADRQVA